MARFTTAVSDISSGIILNYGVYQSNKTETISYPLSYSSIPSVLATVHWNNAEQVSTNRFPHDLTVSTFIHTAATKTFNVSWFSIGY